MLSEQLMSVFQDACADAFVQGRTCIRAIELLLGSLCALGRRTLSRAICAVGRQQQDWSADYKIFSRSQWDPDQLFTPVLKEYRAAVLAAHLRPPKGEPLRPDRSLKVAKPATGKVPRFTVRFRDASRQNCSAGVMDDIPW
jgi:hypothetical protein